jgi:hypothetical protein
MFLKGVNMAFRRQALGPYRIDFRLRGSGAQAGGELDLCSQIRQSGLDVLFDDRIMVKHYSSPRAVGEERTQLIGSVFPDICFNNHYLIAKRFGLPRALAYLFHQRMLGSRPLPGLLACVKWYCKGDRYAWGRMAQLALIGAAGYRLGRRARAEARQNAVSLKLAAPALDSGKPSLNALPIEVGQDRRLLGVFPGSDLRA